MANNVIVSGSTDRTLKVCFRTFFSMICNVNLSLRFGMLRAGHVCTHCMDTLQLFDACIFTQLKLSLGQEMLP